MDSGGARAARSESAPDSLLPCPLPQRSLRGTRAAPGSTYNRTAIPRVLPGCKHNKRERHRVVRCQVGSLYDVQAAEQTAHPKSGPRRRPGITSDRCTQIGEQPEDRRCQRWADLSTLEKARVKSYLTLRHVGLLPLLGLDG